MSTTAITKYKIVVHEERVENLQDERYPSKTRAIIAAMKAGYESEDYYVEEVTEFITGYGRTNELRREQV